MSYATVSLISKSVSLLDRCTASVALEITAGAPGDTASTPTWIFARSWDYAATPGWAEAWESALAGGNIDPGSDGSVITDSMILSRTQQLMNQYPLSDLLSP